MKKWYDEEYEFEIEVTGYLRSGGDLENVGGIGKYEKNGII